MNDILHFGVCNGVQLVQFYIFDLIFQIITLHSALSVSNIRSSDMAKKYQVIKNDGNSYSICITYYATVRQVSNNHTQVLKHTNQLEERLQLFIFNNDIVYDRTDWDCQTVINRKPLWLIDTQRTVRKSIVSHE